MTLRRLLGLVYTSSEYATVITCCEWGGWNVGALKSYWRL
jgi:hypothetical protein